MTQKQKSKQKDKKQNQPKKSGFTLKIRGQIATLQG